MFAHGVSRVACHLYDAMGRHPPGLTKCAVASPLMTGRFAMQTLTMHM